MDQEPAPQKVVRMKADRDAVPLWEPERDEPVSWEDLELPERLAAELREWSERYDARLSTRYRWQVRGGLRGWQADGQRLAARPRLPGGVRRPVTAPAPAPSSTADRTHRSARSRPLDVRIRAASCVRSARCARYGDAAGLQG